MQMIMGLALGSIFVLAASGLSIILGLMDVVNFAHGTFYMLGAYATYVVISYSGSFWVGVISALLLVAVLGGLVEVFTLKPLYGKDPLYPLLMTFGFSVAIPDLVKMIFGLIGKVVEYPPVLSWRSIGAPYPTHPELAVHHSVNVFHHVLFDAVFKKKQLGNDYPGSYSR